MKIPDYIKKRFRNNPALYGKRFRIDQKINGEWIPGKIVYHSLEQTFYIIDEYTIAGVSSRAMFFDTGDVFIEINL